ncbi:MAG: chorismate synthase [Candidatus Algichlamydia australiensis]|nr:chorismate synthase [Chlamydiales bacterium]
MASNSFGHNFRITTWGESHGKAIGVVIDGCPSNLPITCEEIQQELDLRRPGYSAYTSPRKEPDQVEIYSGVFKGKTTGAPISLIIPNRDANSEPYEKIKELLRPGHANATWEKKYGNFDYRGGGRASARETAARVAAGAIAKKLLKTHEIALSAHLVELGGIPAKGKTQERKESKIFCLDSAAEKEMLAYLEELKIAGDSTGGIIELITSPIPFPLGGPVYRKLEADLATAMLSIPASKGFEIGCGFASSAMRGSEHNDSFTPNGLATNNAGGTLGGVASGAPISIRVAFKPTSSIRIAQKTVTKKGKSQTLVLPLKSRHDPCVAIRATAVVEAMAAIVLADHLLFYLDT